MSRPLVALGSAVLVLALATGASVGAYAVTSAVRGPQHTGTPRPAAPSALRAAGTRPPDAAPSNAPPTPAPVPAKVSRRLAGALGAAALGPAVHARIVDLASGAVLLDRGASAPVPPASTAKLFTAAALLSVHKATDRIRTTVRAGTGGAVVLVGGGDPTLTAAPAGRPGRYPQAARMSDLAATLRRANVRPTRIVVANGVFRGPSVSPAWAAEDIPSSYAAPVTALLADGGRDKPGASARSTAPDLAAGHALAVALGRPNLSIVRGPVGAGQVLAGVSSAALGTLVAQMLQGSDNVIAECLARLVALAEGQPASFTGAAAAVRAVLRRILHLDPGAGLLDGSGLAASDRVSAAALVAVLRAASRTPRLGDIVSGLPVAGWSGTLAARYLAAATHAAAGLVRAKTGTLTGVSALAGVLHDRSGGLLVFAVVADRAPRTPQAEGALDALASGLAGCGCS